MNGQPDDWWICLRPLPGDVPTAARMKQLLKLALRRFGLRCVKVSGKGPDGAEIEGEKGSQTKGE